MGGASRKGGELRKHLGTRRRLVIFGLAVAVAAAAGTSAWAALGDTPTVPSRIFVQFNGTTVPASAYSIDGTSSPAKGGATTQAYKVVIDAPVTNDTSLVQAFKSGRVADVQIALFDFEGIPVTRYDFSNATVASYHQTGSNATGSSYEQELVLTSTSLTVS
jgi:hypothetical protein